MARRTTQGRSTATPLDTLAYVFAMPNLRSQSVARAHVLAGINGKVVMLSTIFWSGSFDIHRPTSHLSHPQMTRLETRISHARLANDASRRDQPLRNLSADHLRCKWRCMLEPCSKPINTLQTSFRDKKQCVGGLVENSSVSSKPQPSYCCKGIGVVARHIAIPGCALAGQQQLAGRTHVLPRPS